MQLEQTVSHFCPYEFQQSVDAFVKPEHLPPLEMDMLQNSVEGFQMHIVVGF